MTLADVIAQLGRFDETLSIYAEPRWRASSEARVLDEPFDGSHPPEAEGMTYLTTVDQARQAVAAYRRARPAAGAGQICACVIYYAVYDAIEPSALDEVAAPPAVPDLALAG